MKKMIKLFVFLLFIATSNITAQDLDQLKISDIHKIMEQIFKQHVDKKEMSASILKSALRNFVNQFDPQRIYLLEDEVRPYISPTDAEMEQMLGQYKHKDLSVYTNLNDLVKKSILRARQERKKLKNRLPELFKKFKDNRHKPNDWTTDISTPFAKDQAELKSRIESNFFNFIADASHNFGDSVVLNNEAKTFDHYEKQMEEEENLYLATDDAGDPLPKNEQENLFALHVLKSLAKSLDAHTKVFNNSEAYDMKMRLEKEYTGIGVIVNKHNQNVIVSELVPGTAVEKSGEVEVNDIITAINEKPVKELSFDQIVEMIRDPNADSVTLDLKRKRKNQPDKLFQVELKRETIAINEGRVEFSYQKFGDGIIGKIALHMFYQGENGLSSEKDMREAINKLKEKGNLRGLILDFRDNSGGFLMQAVKVASLFIKSGVIVISKYSSGEERIYRDIDGRRAYDGPLVMLTSRETASAAEIVAQTLQDYGVAIIVGDEQTYGKGTIQNQTVTDSGQTSFFKVTVGTYYTVSGKTPQLGGVKADILVPSFFNNEPVGEGFLDDTVKSSNIPPMYNDTLADIDTELKPWYLLHYAPNMQHKQTKWKKMLPILRVRSHDRISRNKNYQILLSEGQYTVSNGLGLPLKGVWLFPEGNSKSEKDEDLQMTEAVNIVKDMILLEKR